MRKANHHKLINDIRKNANISFFPSRFKDSINTYPSTMAQSADALYKNDKQEKALTIYTYLASYFPFTNEGKNALVECAKILTETEKYKDAIIKYRQFLQFPSDIEKKCNIFFMIGFIYSENLGDPEKAEVNYKWILKNAPECTLVDDAEFMLLHIDEPMLGVDEFLAEARRQGRRFTQK